MLPFGYIWLAHHSLVWLRAPFIPAIHNKHLRITCVDCITEPEQIHPILNGAQEIVVSSPVQIDAHYWCQIGKRRYPVITRNSLVDLYSTTKEEQMCKRQSIVQLGRDMQEQPHFFSPIINLCESWESLWKAKSLHSQINNFRGCTGSEDATHF